jgi:hypothetical protein
MQRHSHNPNLVLCTHDHYAGLPVQISRGPLIAQYLERIYSVMNCALNWHPRTFAFRCDLRFPENYVGTESEDNKALEAFIASFKAKLRHNRHMARQVNRYAHDTAVRYVWCREYGEHGRVHYHCVFFLNNDAFCTLGRFQPGRDNLFNRLHEAWASALGIDFAGVTGLVEIPQGAVWLLQRNQPEELSQFFQRTSYLAKAHSKYFSLGVHAFGSSRV